MKYQLPTTMIDTALSQMNSKIYSILQKVTRLIRKITIIREIITVIMIILMTRIVEIIIMA